MSTLRISAAVSRPGFSLSVDEQIPLSGVTALFGPSGSGKTTVLRLISGLERWPGCVVQCGDTTWQDHGSWRPTHERRVGYVFQDSRLFPHLSVEGNLRFPFGLLKHGGEIGFEEVVETLELRPLLQRTPQSLSAGEIQRVAMGRALLSSPRLLLMDEPLSSLDARRKRDILPFVELQADRFRIPIIYVTHDPNEVARLADRVILLDRGQVAARGGVAETFERVDLWPIFGLHEASSVLNAEVVAKADGMTTLQIGSQRMHVPGTIETLGHKSRIRVYARDVVIATRAIGHVSIRNMLECRLLRIDSSEEIYAELLLDVDSQHLRARITQHALRDLELAVGTTVYALIKSVAFDLA